MKQTKHIPYETITAAVHGDSDAMNKILRHYAGYICHFSKRQVFDEFGNISYQVDEDIREQIEAKLIAQIVTKFNCTALPDGETLTDNLSQVGTDFESTPEC